MELERILGRFVEANASDPMNEVAAELLELLERDAVEPVGQPPGRPVVAELVADKLESRMEKLLQKRDEPPEGIDVIEEAVAHLRAREQDVVAPWTFEDGDGVRWFVLSSGEEVVACYTSAPFVEADQ